MFLFSEVGTTVTYLHPHKSPTWPMFTGTKTPTRILITLISKILEASSTSIVIETRRAEIV